MKKFAAMVFTSMITLPAMNAYADIAKDEDLKKFLDTNQCINCDLSGAKIPGDHQHANISGSNLSSTQLIGDYTKANFSKIIAPNARFGNELSEANFTDAKLAAATFRNTWLTYANFTDADVHQVDFLNANLFGAKITAEQLASAQSICNAILPNGSKGKCK